MKITSAVVLAFAFIRAWSDIPMDLLDETLPPVHDHGVSSKSVVSIEDTDDSGCLENQAIRLSITHFKEAFGEEKVCGRNVVVFDVPEGLILNSQMYFGSNQPCKGGLFDFRDVMQVGSAKRGRHRINKLDAQFTEMPGYTEYGGETWRWDSQYWKRPVIDIEFIEGVIPARNRKFFLDMIVYALERVPNLILYSLPPRVHLKIVETSKAAAYTVPPVNGSWRPNKPQYAVFISADYLRGSWVRSGGKKWMRVTATLDELLIHEFAHLLDFQWDITRLWRDDLPPSGDREDTLPSEVRRYWRKQYRDRLYETDFISEYASTERWEHFAETLVAWAAFHSGRLDWRLYNDSAINRRCTSKQYINSKARSEILWLDQAAKAAAVSASGRLFAP